MVLVSFAANLVILLPLLWAFARRPDSLTPVFGPDTVARRILVCLYAAIAALSVLGTALIGLGYNAQAMALAVPLFTMQILYKGLTVLAVGLNTSVVQINVAVSLLHVATVGSIFAAD